jgi:O-antigen/teichoic acid export membrane protein
MAPTINREVARCSASGGLKEAGKLLHTLAVVYWSMSAVIAVLILVLAPLIAEYWLQSKQLSSQTVSHAIMLMGLVVACRWPIGLYQGALIGAQRLTISSGINMTMVTIGNLGAVAVLAFVSPTIEAFFTWQALVGFAYAIAMRMAAWRIVGRSIQTKFDVDRLKSVWRFAAGMGGISLTALVFTQLDKLILSKMLGLEEYGHYMLATVVVSGLYVLVSPVFNVIYPRMSTLVASGNATGLTDLYRLGTRLLATVLFPTAMLLAVYSQDLVYIWTGNPDIASKVAPVISLLVIGSALNGVMFFPYALQLAYGMTWIPLTINIVLMCFLLPLIIFLAQNYGALGGAVAWLTSQIVYLMIGPWLTHRFILKKLASKWLIKDVGVPLILSTLIGFFLYYKTKETDYSIQAKFIWGGGMAIFSIGLSLWFSPKLRTAARKYIENRTVNCAK